MIYKRFVAKSFDEAKKKMLLEFGTKGYILKRCDVVKKRFLGLKREKYVEIQAGRSEDKKVILEEKKSMKQGLVEFESKASLQANNFLEEMISNQERRDGLMNSRYLKERERKINKLQQAINEKKRNNMENIFLEKTKSVDFLQKQTFEDHFGRDDVLLKNSKEESISENETLSKNNSSREKELCFKVYDFLIEREFSDYFARNICKDLEIDDVVTEEDKSYLSEMVSSKMLYSGDVKNYAANPNLIFFVGPTGVGKTTTLAKLASRFSLKENKSLVMATFDIKRIMATAQLEKYAHIMGVPFKALYEKKDFTKWVKDHIDKNLIFVDTTGTSQHDEKSLDEIETFVNYLNYPKEVCLCLSANTRYRDLVKVAHGFERAKYDRILITKVDESYSLGSVLSVAYEMKMPLYFITDGQEVPNDIFLLDKKNMMKSLLKEW